MLITYCYKRYEK